MALDCIRLQQIQKFFLENTTILGVDYLSEMRSYSNRLYWSKMTDMYLNLKQIIIMLTTTSNRRGQVRSVLAY